ncbi:MAG TPA: hypothetical protein VFA12_11795 [Stellaceae bacterium]|nr:hypothetical protein [Stellaceae bacterium]
MMRRIICLALFLGATALLLHDADLALSMRNYVQDQFTGLRLATRLN